ncbi:MAG TPA: hypothetical protein VND62_05505 [Acidimicrobiales bacterium]|nr:hypothetical protein [Acidimicrobiales bacterium]
MSREALGDAPHAAGAPRAAWPADRWADRWARWATRGNLAEICAGLLVVAVAVVANVLYLAGVFDADSMSSTAALGSTLQHGVLSGLPTIDPNAGYTSQALGHLSAVDLLHGRAPWWNPYEGTGSPLAAELQSASFFPPTLLLWFRNGQVWLRIVIQAAAGLATFRLLRRLDVGRWPAAALGSAFALDGTFAWFMHAPANEVALLPLLLLGIEQARAAALAGRRRGYALVAVALALSVYAGFPETAYLDGILALLWAVVRVPRADWAMLRRYAARLGAGAVAGALLAAPLVVAVADYAPYATFGQHRGSVFNLVHVVRPGAGMLFFPYLFGPIFGFSQASPTLGAAWSQVGGYLTTSLLVLGVLALFGRRHRPLRLALAVWLVLALGRTYGIEPFWRAFDLLPFMGHVGTYRYLWPSIELAAVVLAALAVDDLRRGLVPWWTGAVALAAGAGVAAATALSGSSILSSTAHLGGSGDWATGSLVWGFTVLAAIGALAASGRGAWRAAVVSVVVVLDTAAMFVLPELSAPRAVAYDGRLVVWLQHHSAVQRFFTLGPLQANYGSYFGVMEADVHDLPNPKAYARDIARHLDTNTGVSFTGVHMVDPSGSTPLDEVEHHLAAYEAIGVAYLVAFAGEIAPTSVAPLGLHEVYTDGFAAVFRLPHPGGYFSASGGCRLSDETVDSVRARCPRAATLVRRELWMPGTYATVTPGAPSAGSSAPSSTVGMQRSGALSESVALRAGTSHVSISYTPPHEDLAVAGAALGILGLLAPLGPRIVRRLRRRG